MGRPPDLVEMNTYAYDFAVRNIGPAGILNASSFAARVDLPSLGGTDSPRSITAADVDGDGKLDLRCFNGPFNTVVIYRNISTPGSLTTESFAAPVSLNVGTDPAPFTSAIWMAMAGRKSSWPLRR